MTGFDHVNESCDLTGIQDDTRIYSHSLKLSGQSHYLYGICIKKKQWFISKHGEKKGFLFCQRMIWRNTEKQIFSINNARITFINGRLFGIDNCDIKFSSSTRLQALIEPYSNRRKSTSGKLSFKDKYNSGR